MVDSRVSPCSLPGVREKNRLASRSEEDILEGFPPAPHPRPPRSDADIPTCFRSAVGPGHKQEVQQGKGGSECGEYLADTRLQRMW